MLLDIFAYSDASTGKCYFSELTFSVLNIEIVVTVATSNEWEIPGKTFYAIERH